MKPITEEEILKSNRFVKWRKQKAANPHAAEKYVTKAVRYIPTREEAKKMNLRTLGLGWVPLRMATQRDYDKIPHIIEPHCSHCSHYEVLPNETMYCSKLQKRITARKKPCKSYRER